MNKKGFTLIELISIVLILALLLIIITTNGFGIFKRSKNTITSINLNLIKESANLLMLDVLYCDDDFNSNLLNEFGVSNCSDLQEKANEETGLNITVKILYDYGYITGDDIKVIYDKQPSYFVNARISYDEIIIKVDDKYLYYED